MATEIDPVVGNWYRDEESDRTFEVVALDEDEGTVVIQFFEAEVEELDIDSWWWSQGARVPLRLPRRRTRRKCGRR